MAAVSSLKKFGAMIMVLGWGVPLAWDPCLITFL